jgi:putative thioredoxin
MKLIEAIRAFTEGKATDAYEMIAKAIVDDPVNPRLPLTMCKLLKHEERYPEALKLIESLPEDIRSNKEIMQFHDLLSICNEADTSQNISSLAEQVISSPKNIEAKQQLSVHYIIEEQFEKALQQLSEMIEIDANYQDNYAQKSMIKVFNIIGSDSDLASRFKPNLKRFAH